MIQDILPSRLYNGYDICDPHEDDILVFISDNKLLCAITEDGLRMPAYSETEAADCRYLIRVDNTSFFTSADQKALAVLLERDYAFHPIADLRGCSPRWLCFGALTAFSYASWYEKNKFCGRCGTELLHSDRERAMVCPDCHNQVYPKICPVVIVGVIKDDTILLTKYKNKMSIDRYALIAGFAEIGESIEQTVAREVMEETGIRVKNLKFYKSQPWAFSDSLLMGFYCEEDGDDEARPDGVELGFASWMTRDRVPACQDDVSLTSEMMGRFRELGRAVLD